MRRKQRLTVSQKLSNAGGVPLDVMSRFPYITMCSNREITIEDAGKLLHYDMKLVKVKQRKVTLCVSGTDLKVLCLSNGDLRVCGYINSVEFE